MREGFKQMGRGRHSRQRNDRPEVGAGLPVAKLVQEGQAADVQ